MPAKKLKALIAPTRASQTPLTADMTGPTADGRFVVNVDRVVLTRTDDSQVAPSASHYAVTATGNLYETAAIDEAWQGIYAASYQDAVGAVGALGFFAIGAADGDYWYAATHAEALALVSIDSVSATVASVNAATSAGVVTLTSTVATNGTIPVIFRGADYLDTHGEAFTWIVAEPDNLLIGNASCSFGGYREGYGEWKVAGSLTDNLDGTWTMKFDLTGEDTINCRPGDKYRWTAGITADSEAKMLVRVDGLTSIRDNYMEATRFSG